MTQRVKVLKLTGTDGNIFAIAGKVHKALRETGRQDLAKRVAEIQTQGSYEEALSFLVSLLKEAGLEVR